MREEIRKRIERSDPLPKKNVKTRRVQFDTCVICGKPFKGDDCPHTSGDQRLAYDVYNADVLLN